MSPKKGSFPKKFRLYRKHEKDSLFAKGNSFMAYPFRVTYMLASPEISHLSALISVPKSKISTAPLRNHIKRLTREALRIQKESLLLILIEKNICINFALIYIPDKKLEFKEINKGISKLIFKLNEIANNYSATIKE